MMATKENDSPSREEIEAAQLKMRRYLLTEWSNNSAEHEDWIQEASVKWCKAPEQAPALIVGRTAKSSTRTKKRQRQALEKHGPVEEARASDEERVTAQCDLDAQRRPVPIVKLTLAGDDLREVRPEELAKAALATDLSELATRYRLAHRDRPDEDRLASAATVMSAIADAIDREGDARAAQLIDELSKASLKYFGTDRGPRSKAGERSLLLALCEAATLGDLSARKRHARTVLRAVRSSLRIRRDVGLRHVGMDGPEATSQGALTAEFGKALDDVERALSGAVEANADGRTRLRAVLGALKGDRLKVKNLFADEGTRKSRAKKRG